MKRPSSLGLTADGNGNVLKADPVIGPYSPSSVVSETTRRKKKAKLRQPKMDAVSTPRVTCAYLNSYVGRNVMIVGKVIQLRGEEALIDADGNITAYLNRVSICLPSCFPRSPFSRMRIKRV